MRKLLTVILLLSALLPFPLGSDATADTNWPQYRGPQSRGVSTQTNLPDRWSATENVAWKCDLPGRGWSSPIVWKDRVFLTTVINSGKSEEPKKGLYFGGDRPKPPSTIHQWQVFCLDLNTGKVLWRRQVHEGKPETSIHLKNSYASETPVTDGERVYFYFGNLGVFCFDFDGKQLWKHVVKPEPTRLGWGTSASPVLYRDRLYIVNDNEKESYLLALDAKTGKQLWRTARDEKSNWSTPFLWENGKRSEIVTLGSGKVRSYDLEGNLLWWLKGMSSITIATPYEDNGLLYISSGYVADVSRPIYAVRPGAKGDISLKTGESSNEFVVWSLPKAAPYNPTTLIYNDRLYVLLDRGFVSCYQPRDGKAIYSQKRLPNGRAFTSSPWACGGKVFCLDEDGVTFVLQAGDDFKVLHTNTLAEDDMCMATPALAGDRLLIRTAARLYCIAASAANLKERQPPAARVEPPRIEPTEMYHDVGASGFAGSVLCFGLPDEGETDQEKKPDFKVPNNVTFRMADILSEGTRMAAEVFAPKTTKTEKLPTIIMSHGWGGTAASLRPDAIVFARAGYLVVTFDYRGWGNSDSRLILTGNKLEKKDRKLIAEVKEVREVVDPIDQTTDIMNAINWTVGEKRCDPERIGIWGSSFSGGHVVYVAARDPRVKAFVSQVGSMDGRWVINTPQLRNYTFDQGTARTRGQIGYPKPKEKFGALTGAPVIEKFVGFAPIEDIGRCKKCAKLFIIAENEELFDNKDNAILAHERATGIKKLVTIKGIKHYGIYNEARDNAQKEALAWFDQYLKP
jgi:outer membrane protein assembly factor BamB/dienelactone hydrolase